jgi:CHAT domain-containing protein
LDVFLSLASRLGVTQTEAYGHVLAWKGTVLERQRRERELRRQLLAQGDPELLRLLDQRQSVVARLATLALANPPARPGVAEGRRRELERLSQQEDDLERELAERSDAFRHARSEAEITPDALAAKLPRGSALVDFFEYVHFSPTPGKRWHFDEERRVVAFVVRPDAPIGCVELGSADTIARAIDAWLPAVQHPGPYHGEAAAAHVKRLIWGPLQAHLDGIGSVLVSPYGKLAMVPLGALPGEREGTFLIEQYEIALIPVPHMLRNGNGRTTKEADGERPSLLLVGDVDYGGDPGPAEKVASRMATVRAREQGFDQFARLAYTAGEIAAIDRDFRERFGGLGTEKLSGKNASEGRVKKAASTHRYLHLATHGFFDERAMDSASNPGVGRRTAAESGLLKGPGGRGSVTWHPGLLSGLALTGANVRPTPESKDDGILTALEVAELDLSGVELAVLSACETGLGKVAGGEGLLGLQRAFQAAGAGSVVATLWSVPDSQTMELMSQFYKNLWERNLAPRAALREAQLDILRHRRRSGGKSEGTSRGAKVLHDDS